MKTVEVIEKKILELKKEFNIPPTYCGEYEYNLWRDKLNSKIDVLEEVLYEIKL